MDNAADLEILYDKFTGSRCYLETDTRHRHTGAKLHKNIEDVYKCEQLCSHNKTCRAFSFKHHSNSRYIQCYIHLDEDGTIKYISHRYSKTDCYIIKQFSCNDQF